jgi:hypothetical protein
MQINIFEELLWPQFIRIEKYSKLPLNEQVAAYQQYVYDLSAARQNWLNYQNKGPLYKKSIQNIGFLAQEESYINTSGSLDYFTILQEDGSSIFVTALV